MNKGDVGSIDPILKETIHKIRLVAFDFDGVFTDNMVYVFQDGCAYFIVFERAGLSI